MEVKSVYNFVPAPKEEEVFKPDWADKVSHDLPFEDGESGEIELTITAKTPIFIRNGHSQKDADLFKKQQKGELPNPTEKEQKAIDRYLSFSNVERNGKKEYFIPGSSLKGMFRNVLEIMSLSRMKQIADDRYSFRDLTRNSLYMKSYDTNKVSCGWLSEDEEGVWRIEDWGKPLRIHHSEVDKILGTGFRNEFLNKNPKEKIAKYKYDKIKGKSLVSTFISEVNERNIIGKYSETGKEGTIVFTGQSGKRKEQGGRPSGKVHEFVFIKPDKENIIKLSVKEQKDFKFIYLDHDKQNTSKDWEFWRDKLEKGEKVPVFFNKSSNTKVKHFGLAYMYKLPFEHSIKETLPYKNYDLLNKDLSELIFGDTSKDNTLKGRVFIAHAFSENAIEGEIQKEILAGPKASYFPFYLNQKGGNYKTYQDKDATIRGYKRYPIQNNKQNGVYDSKQLKNDKVFSIFKPIENGAEFSSKIRFHNLKKCEIGALLSAITFHGNEEKSFHSIGGARPFGYGQIKLSNISLKGLDQSKDEYLTEFENLMGGENWLNSDQLVELVTMSQISNDSLGYPKEPKTFVDYKTNKLSLNKYSEIVEKPSMVQSIAKLVEINKNIDDFTFESTNFNNLKEHIKELGYTEIPDNLQNHLKEAIKNIYQNHNASRRKLQKPFDEEYIWYKIITGWVGQETAKIWHNELNTNNQNN